MRMSGSLAEFAYMMAGWRRWWWLLAVVTGSLTISGCSRKLTVPVTAVVKVDSGYVDKPIEKLPADSTDLLYRGLTRQTFSFYQRANHALVWSRGGELTLLADTLIQFLTDLPYRGLDPASYRLAEIDSLVHLQNETRNLTRVDALLTDAFLSVSYRLHFGTSITQRDTTAIALLHRVIQNGDLTEQLESMEPGALGYRLLKRHLGFLLDSMHVVGSNGVEHQIQIISRNMDRWRAYPVVGSRYILVNIPSFTLQVVSNDSVVLESAVIVGTPETPTPILSSTVECFVTYPYWNVPRKIAIEEYLPAIQKDSTFLSKNNFDVLDRKGEVMIADSVPWKTFTKNFFPVRLRQREGVDNSLGVLKFVFDNPYAVYVHDTNAKGLFKKKVRAFSHGCIRLEKSIELAHYLATGGAVAKSAQVEKYLAEQTRHVVNLAEPIPIYVRYFTAKVTVGKIEYYLDIYELDK